MTNLKSDFLQQYGPWALIAGASQGLGAAFAGQIAERGLNLVLVARRAEKLNDLAEHFAEQYAVQVRVVSLDLSEEGSIGSLVERTSDLEIGLLVYNAAYSRIGPFFAATLEQHQKEIDTNCRAPLALVYLFGERMLSRKRGGIILMSSLSSSQGTALISNYSATKAYNLILAEGLWEELRSKGISVLACCAGATRTPNYLLSLQRSGAHERFAAMLPESVAREALAALGKQPSVIPGRSNRLSGFIMRRLLPRSVAIRFMGKVLRGMYPAATHELE
jgi:short-subunit dehydrogenase